MIEDVVYVFKFIVLRDFFVDCGIGVEGGDLNDLFY